MSLSKLRTLYLSRSILASSTVTVINPLEQQKRELNTSRICSAKLAHLKKPQWNRAVGEAEKIVGYPTSYLSLRWLLTDEIANIALHLRKLLGTEHPLLKTVKGLLYNTNNNLQALGLVVLLVSKAAGHARDLTHLEQDKAAGVLQSQRILAEVTEMIRTSHTVHKGLLNIKQQVNAEGELMYGNKIALLSGDYLLSNSSIELANLKNQELVELMSSAFRDLAEAEFVGPRDKQNNPLPAKPRPDIVEYKQFTNQSYEPWVISEALGHATSEWTLRHTLNAASLMAKGCQGTLILAGHPIEIQEKGYLFGKHLALAWQARLDREPFFDYSTGPFSLISAPVLFTLQHKPEVYQIIEAGLESVDDVDYEALRKEVLEGPGLELTTKLQQEHSGIALDILNELAPGDARTALANIIIAMQNV